MTIAIITHCVQVLCLRSLSFVNCLLVHAVSGFWKQEIGGMYQWGFFFNRAAFGKNQVWLASNASGMNLPLRHPLMMTWWKESNANHSSHLDYSEIVSFAYLIMLMIIAWDALMFYCVQFLLFCFHARPEAHRPELLSPVSVVSAIWALPIIAYTYVTIFGQM